MGGRGRRAFRKHIQLHPDLTHTVIVTAQTERPYEMPLMPDLDLPKAGYLIVASAWDGAKTPFYPLFPQDRAWVLVAREGRTLDEHPVESGHRLGMDEPTLVWQNGTQRIELYVDGMTHEDFTQAMASQFRCHEKWLRHQQAHVAHTYAITASTGASMKPASAWIICPSMMSVRNCGMARAWSVGACWSACMISSSPDTASTRAIARRIGKHIGRVEITLINSAGQHKAHAIVVDDMDVDFRLPNDIKRDAKTTGWYVRLWASTPCIARTPCASMCRAS
jgi:hypothetical protein